ncbi:MAG: 3-isopropylmalate dehydratase large subunit [candidate division Zixibacteria bacterium]|nr:3-isopropylmalate dehydratase large subunit [candidate division Zixibacteria bacterium]
MRGKTIVEKILSRASGVDAFANDRVWAEVDLVVIRDFGGPNAVLEFDKFTNKGRVKDPEKIALTFDYQAPAKDMKVAQNQVLCREFAKRQGIKNLFDVNWGIGQHVLLERGMIKPGSVVIGTDSHMNLLGSVGSFASGVGNTDIVAAWYSGKLWFRVPETIKVFFKGNYKEPVSAKDLTLKFVKEIGTDEPNYKSLELYGEPIDNLSLAGRLTLGSMMTEINAKIGFIQPNGEPLEFLRQRCGDELEIVTSDEDAQFTDEVEINVEKLVPQIACPHNPDNVKPVEEVEGTPFNEGFIGSCTNGRLEDFKAAAKILKKAGKIHPDVRLIIVPATREVAMNMLEAGLYHIFMGVGAMVTNPGCSLCTSGHHGVLGKGDVLLSTSNRNFLGKLGKGAEVYLCSPATVAASAVEGKITDPRKYW